MSDNSDFAAVMAADDRPESDYDRGYDDGWHDGSMLLRDLLHRFRDFVFDKTDVAELEFTADGDNPIWAEVAQAIQIPKSCVDE